MLKARLHLIIWKEAVIVVKVMAKMSPSYSKSFLSLEMDASSLKLVSGGVPPFKQNIE